MYLKKALKPNGRIYLTIVEKYRDPKDGKSKDRPVKVIGYADEYLDKYEDPVKHFKELAKKMTLEASEEKKKKLITKIIDLDEELSISDTEEKNLGYGFIKHIYKELEIDKFFKKKLEKEDTKLEVEKIFELLVFSRIINPGSKKYSYENKDFFFEKFDGFKLDDVYRALDIITKYDEELQRWIYDHSVTIYKRDLSATYFDCTNYYYDVSSPDEDEIDDEGNLLLKRYRKYGPEKNHRKDPIVELGLLMDGSGIPLSYGLFPGNESEKVHMLPIIKKAKINFGFQRTIVVADRGLNTSDNIYYLNGKNSSDNNQMDGYVYGQSIRSADKEFKDWCIKSEGYEDTIIEENGSAITFRHKSRIYPKKISVNVNIKGETKKKTITVDQKQMVYYSEKYAKKQRLEREKSINRAKDLIAHPKKYDRVSAKGASGYVRNIAYNEETGEIVSLNLKLDEEKIEEEKKYDGYYSIVTSELKMDDIRLREVYRGLAKIEETFKITKSELDTRPIYVTTNPHIEAHFTTCFTAIVLLRLLQNRLDNKYPAHQIINSLKKYRCIPEEKNIYRILSSDEILIECGKIFGSQDTTKKYRSREEIRRFLKY